MYRFYQAQEDLAARLRPLALDAASVLRAWQSGRPGILPLAQAAASLQLLEAAGTTHRKPAFRLGPLRLDGRLVEVREEVVRTTPFGRLLRFSKDAAQQGPRVLLVAPQSGHFATRLRGTVATLLPEHDVHITDWTDAREIPAAAGPFGLDDMVAQVMEWLEAMGPGAHLLAVSQPAVAVLAATALMAEDGNPARPRSLTLVGGPVDPRIDPTQEEALARLVPFAWFEQHSVDRVPRRFPGAGRWVRPGAQQFTASMLADLRRHVAAQLDQYGNLVGGDAAAAAAHQRRYAELRSVMDVPGELYLDTIRRVFQVPELALGRMRWRGRPVRPAAIRDTALLTIEGSADESCSPGQTRAALRLCPALPAGMARNHLQPGATHDALFEGAGWEAQVYPLVRALIRSRD